MNSIFLQRTRRIATRHIITANKRHFYNSKNIQFYRNRQVRNLRKIYTYRISSRNISGYWWRALIKAFETKKETNINNYQLLIMCFLPIIKFLYSYTTFEKEISINRIYKRVVCGFQVFMFSDTNGNQYKMGYSMWNLHFTECELYDKLNNHFTENKSEKVVIKGYGWRVPFFSIYPNVVTFKKEKKKKEENVSEKSLFLE